MYMSGKYYVKKNIWRGKSQHNYKINHYKMDVKEKEAQVRYEEEGSKRVNTAQLI